MVELFAEIGGAFNHPALVGCWVSNSQTSGVAAQTAVAPSRVPMPSRLRNTAILGNPKHRQEGEHGWHEKEWKYQEADWLPCRSTSKKPAGGRTGFMPSAVVNTWVVEPLTSRRSPR